MNPNLDATMLQTANIHATDLVFHGPEGAVLLASKGYAHRLPNNAGLSYLAGDAHLFYVLCQWGNEYVVWLYNAKDQSCYEGSYRPNFNDAVKVYASRNL